MPIDCDLTCCTHAFPGIIAMGSRRKDLRLSFLDRGWDTPIASTQIHEQIAGSNLSSCGCVAATKAREKARVSQQLKALRATPNVVITLN